VDVDADGQSIDGRSPETRRSEQESLPLGDEGGAGAGSNGGPRPSWLETMEARDARPRAPTSDDGVGRKADGKADVGTTAEVDRDPDPPFLPDDDEPAAVEAGAPEPGEHEAAPGTERSAPARNPRLPREPRRRENRAPAPAVDTSAGSRPRPPSPGSAPASTRPSSTSGKRPGTRAAPTPRPASPTRARRDPPSRRAS
jgi:hypothetical protein